MSSGKNTPQYKKLLECVPKLNQALTAGNGAAIINLSPELCCRGLISDANNQSMQNIYMDPGIRAAQLTGFITTKVDLNAENYDKFIEALEVHEATFSDILPLLKSGTNLLCYYTVCCIVTYCNSDHDTNILAIMRPLLLLWYVY